MRRKKIPLHTGELSDLGISIEFMNSKQPEADLLHPHRDDHYIFFLQQKGSTHIMIDLNLLTLKDACLYFIRPGQVHYYLRQKMTGWYFALSTGIIEKDFRNYLDKLASQHIFTKDTHKLATVLSLLDKVSRSPEKSNFKTKEIQAYVNAVVSIVCSSFSTTEKMNVKPQNREQQISIEFKQLLQANFHTLKKPAEYAKLLHISPAYLSELLVRSTGFSTSYWIQQELFLEAKRLLHHTDLNSKEIAFELGFEDHAYFARLFKKVNGLTPIGFRKAYRNLSN
jgi:YesN/AraC family two-component response regulator